MFRFFFIILLFIYANASMTKEQISTYIKSPLKLGEKDINIPVWEILDENNKIVTDHKYALAGVSAAVYSDQLTTLPFSNITKIF